MTMAMAMAMAMAMMVYNLVINCRCRIYSNSNIYTGFLHNCFHQTTLPHSLTPAARDPTLPVPPVQTRP